MLYDLGKVPELELPDEDSAPSVTLQDLITQTDADGNPIMRYNDVNHVSTFLNVFE